MRYVIFKMHLVTHPCEFQTPRYFMMWPLAYNHLLSQSYYATCYQCFNCCSASSAQVHDEHKCAFIERDIGLRVPNRC